MTACSVLSNAPANGLNTDYVTMIQAAFQPTWWNSNAVVDAGGNFLHTGTPQNTNEYSMMEYNFSMFWGVAIQAYEATLVSDSSRFDQFMEGDHTALTALEQRGLDRFTGKGGCSHCHNGAEFTDAAVSSIQSRGVVEQLLNGSWHDVGFHNIGVRPTTDDLGIAAGDPSGLASLSVAAWLRRVWRRVHLFPSTPLLQSAEPSRLLVFATLSSLVPTSSMADRPRSARWSISTAAVETSPPQTLIPAWRRPASAQMTNRLLWLSSSRLLMNV